MGSTVICVEVIHTKYLSIQFPVEPILDIFVSMVFLKIMKKLSKIICINENLFLTLYLLFTNSILKIMKTINVFFTTILLFSGLHAQENKRQQTVFFELMGQSIVYSVNYDSRFFEGDGGFGAHIGLGYIPVQEFLGLSDVHFFSVPASVYYLIGKHGNYFEVGAGVSLLSTVKAKNGLHIGREFLGTLCIGYRRQPLNKGLLFRIGTTPLVALNSTEGFVGLPFYPGISLGYAF
ncbi:hypothetical protein AGMMS49982_12690 [Bacteroidia bacterium]|nr:hypothetical protein AGMMS49982_12690 [Bacteroidia bacterium]